MKLSFKPYNIGCEPSPSVPAETLIQDGLLTYLLFYAVSKTKDERGYLRDLGVAALECRGCSSTKFGYPNDEGLPEHPFYRLGMGEIDSDVIEVIGSPWAQEVAKQQQESVVRIWGRRDSPSKPGSIMPQKHFIITLKEATFECVADDLQVVTFAHDFQQAFSYVSQKICEH